MKTELSESTARELIGAVKALTMQLKARNEVWVKASVIVKHTGWNYERMRVARETELVEYKDRTVIRKGKEVRSRFYNLASIDRQYIKQHVEL